MKKAFITGGSGAIGSAICQRLAAQNYHVFIHAHNQIGNAKQVQQSIHSKSGVAEIVQFDITDSHACAEVLKSLIEEKPFQVVVHAAGVHADAPLAGMSEQQWKNVINISLHGFYNVIHPLLLPMIGTRWGRIIAISSIAGVMGNRGQANYAAAKAGLHGACKSLAIEVASRGVTSNVVAPGVIESPMHSDELFSEKKIKQMVPMQRMGKPDEVAALVAFLASDEASYISGQVIGVNGAMA